VSGAGELHAPPSTSSKKRQSLDAIDVDFRALALRDLADAALEAASGGGASRASVRVHRVRRGELRLRDGRLASNEETTSNGVSVQVVLDGTRGFAAEGDLALRARRLRLRRLRRARAHVADGERLAPAGSRRPLD
jgi:TldD protein